MVPEILAEQFELLADAPNAIAELRELILQLGVRGKLLDHNEHDTSAAELLANIDSARANLVDEGKIRKGKLLGRVNSQEIPFSPPSNWEWVRIGDALELVNGRAFKPAEWSTKGLPIIRIQNLNDESAAFNCCERDIDRKFHVSDGDFLISWSGTPGTSFGAFIWMRGPALLNQHIFRAQLIGDAFEKTFLRLAVNARLDEMIAQAHGGVGLRHITKGKLENLCIPLPPLAEQRRIVAKVDELMALCDELEERQRKRNEVRIQACTDSHAALTSATTPKQFARHWTRIAGHFDLLYDTPQNVQELRQVILQLAVQGKLVEQDLGDESAEDTVRQHNEAYVAQELVEDDSGIREMVAQSLPDRWTWVTVRDVSTHRLGKMLDKAKNTGKPWPYLRNTNVHWFRFDLSSIKEMLLGEDEVEEYRVLPDDLLICEGGHGIGRTAVWKDESREIMFQKALHRVRPLPSLNSDYLSFCIKAYYDFGILQHFYTGAGIPHFTGKSLAKVQFPLPPRAEQDRIVAKVNQLMAICDELQSKLTQSQAKSEKLMEAVVAGVVEG